MGFANFYRRFIEGFSRTCTPLYNLLKKTEDETQEKTTDPKQHQKNLRKAPFQSNTPSEEVFQSLKIKFCTAPILKHLNPALETILETNASDYVVSGIPSQCHPAPDGPNGATQTTLHPVAYLSEKMTTAECNYGIGE